MTFHYGLAGGVAMGSTEVVGRSGWRRTEDLNDPVPPMYASLGWAPGGDANLQNRRVRRFRRTVRSHLEMTAEHGPADPGACGSERPDNGMYDARRMDYSGARARQRDVRDDAASRRARGAAGRRVRR